MFIDRKWKKDDIERDPFSAGKQGLELTNKYVVLIVVGLVLVFSSIGVYVYIVKAPSPPPKENTDVVKSGDNATSTAGLPENSGIGGEGDPAGGNNGDFTKAEAITFGNFYEPKRDDFIPDFKNYNLPLNIKTDVINYYEISRKLNLDPYLDDLNRQGFAIIPDQLDAGSSDYYALYRALAGRDIPIVITSDFILYHWQNELKQIDKDIESSVFFQNVWDISKGMYDVALARYKYRYSEIGPVNDPLLESERLETAYFAVALALLKPRPDQIDPKSNLTGMAKFNQQEADDYSFDMREEIRDQVAKEVGLITGAAQTVKSPILLYSRDYRKFQVPDEYRSSAKLNNFYLATKWLNTVFPIYYQSDDCPGCSLDYFDWVINMGAAGLIAQDFRDNQPIKNQWAIVYKMISFFTGLRSDLTYLNYVDAYNQLFGSEYKVENIYSPDNDKREQNIADLQAVLAANRFKEIEGEIDRAAAASRPQLGMRILQEPYWPNDYLLNYLTGTDMTVIGTPDSSQKITLCGQRGETQYRCRGFGLDLVNLMNGVDIPSDTFLANTNYRFYPQKVSDLRRELDQFDINTWNNNIYWLTLDTDKQLLTYRRDGLPAYAASDSWEERKAYNAYLGGWVNLHLGFDSYDRYQSETKTGLGVSATCNQFNYVEPQIDFYRELINRNNMLEQALVALGISKKTNTTAIQLKELNQAIEDFITIAKKELSDTPLDDNDCRYINTFAQQYKLKRKAATGFTIEFKSGKKLSESIKGVKMLAIIYESNGKKVLTFGPIFNYKEN